MKVTCDSKTWVDAGCAIRFSFVLDENVKVGPRNDSSFELVFTSPETADQFSPGLPYDLSLTGLLAKDSGLAAETPAPSDSGSREASDTDFAPVQPDATPQVAQEAAPVAPAQDAGQETPGTVEAKPETVDVSLVSPDFTNQNVDQSISPSASS